MQPQNLGSSGGVVDGNCDGHELGATELVGRGVGAGESVGSDEGVAEGV